MPYRNMAALSVPSTVAIPTCNHCGNEWIDSQTAAALDEALSQDDRLVVASTVTLVELTANESGRGFYHRCLGDEMLSMGEYVPDSWDDFDRWAGILAWNLTLAALLGRASDIGYANGEDDNYYGGDLYKGPYPSLDIEE